MLTWWCCRRKKRSKGALATPFKKQEVAKKGTESPDDSASEGGRPLEREGPLKTDVVPYSQYRQQRLDNIRGSVGLPGGDFGTVPDPLDPVADPLLRSMALVKSVHPITSHTTVEVCGRGSKRQMPDS